MQKKYQWILLLLLISVSGLIRLVSWDKNVLNIDELEWIYLLHRVKINPIPFSGFVAHTTGPLAIFNLSIINLFQKIPSLYGLRLFQFFLCIVPTFILLFEGLTSKAKRFGILFFFLIISSPEFNYSLFKPFDDFYAYNTEYQIMLFMACIYFLQSKKVISNLTVLLLVLLMIGLFFIKIQALPFVVYFWVLYFIQLVWFHSTYVKYYVLSTVLIVFIIYLIFSFLGIWESFLYEYLQMNFDYSNAETFSLIAQLKNYYQVWIFPLTFYWLLLLLFMLMGIYSLFKKQVIEIPAIDFIKAWLLLLFTMLVLLISTYNFTHYKVLLFFPLSLVFGELCGKFIKRQWEVRTLLLIVISFFSLYHEYFINMVKLNFADEEEKKKVMNIGFKPHYVLSKNPFWTTNSPLDLAERDAVLHFSKQQVQNRLSNKRIYIFGWFTAQGYYYELLKYAEPISKSSHNHYLVNFYLQKKWSKFLKEQDDLLEEFKKHRPSILMDSEGVIDLLKNQKIGRYVNQHFQLIYQTRQFKIWKSK